MRPPRSPVLAPPMPLALLGTLLLGATAEAQQVGSATATAHADVGVGGGGLVGFWLLAILVVGGALATIVQRNTVNAVMSLVASFFGLAGLYLMLSAEFLAALQVLVYAGAIMTLFVFVVMVLNREEAEPIAWRGWITKGLGVVATAYLVIRTATYLFRDRPARTDLPPAGFGGVADVGQVLFTKYLFPFEALSLMLMVAVIGAVVVARTPRKHVEEHVGGLAHHPGDDEADEADEAARAHDAASHAAGH